MLVIYFIIIYLLLYINNILFFNFYLEVDEILFLSIFDLIFKNYSI